MSELDDLIAGLRSPDKSNVYSALIEIGKARRRDLEGEVASFLDHREPMLRGAALRVLGFYWRLPPYRETAMRLARLAAFPEERVMAFLAIGAYERGTRSPEALAVLVSAANDPDVDSYVRASAYDSFLSVAGVEAAVRARAGSGSRLD